MHAPPTPTPQRTCGTSATETESHPQEPPLTDTCDIWSSARCVKRPCNTGRAQRPPEAHRPAPGPGEGRTEAWAHHSRLQSCLRQPTPLWDRPRLQAEPAAGQVCANQSIPVCSGHKPRPRLQPSSLGTGHSGFSLPSTKANAVCPLSSSHRLDTLPAAAPAWPQALFPSWRSAAWLGQPKAL